ncbi:MAG TPA: flagellar export chaperone FliS [Firmicutes bacterium]|jgi:flagellar secretion chaperone FliS|nr:flagellar export chaperone FliS [Bacillota bacterium]
MALSKGQAIYQSNSILTSKPEELTLMLYNGLVKFLIQAQKGMEEKNIQKSHDNLIKAQNIVIEFKATLKPEYEISKALGLLYDYMYRRLVEANLQKDGKIVSEVLGYVTELRDAWAQAMKKNKEQEVLQHIPQAK